MSTTIDHDALAADGLAALKRGDAATARTAFLAIEEAGRGTPRSRLLLAQAAARTGDADLAQRTLDRIIADEPANLYAFIMKGDLARQAGDIRAAVSWYQGALKQAPRAGQLPQDLIVALRRAEQTVAEAQGQFLAHLESQLADMQAGPRFAQALDILAGRREVFPQAPTSFYYPGLPTIQFFDPADFPWMAGMVDQAPAMLAELEAVLAGDKGMVPYVEGDPNRPVKRHSLLGDPNWSAFHLWKGGVPVGGNADRCPATMAALATVPTPRIEGRSPMAMFSVLRPGTHIPAHNGMLNTRLICHLPLIVPEGCRLRVGNETRVVERFVPMIFDDSIEHEAWNDSGETRVVLLFEVWRPELDAAERAALTALYDSIGVYGGHDGAA